MTKVNVMLLSRKNYGIHLTDKGHANLGHL